MPGVLTLAYLIISFTISSLKHAMALADVPVKQRGDMGMLLLHWCCFVRAASCGDDAIDIILSAVK